MTNLYRLLLGWLLCASVPVFGQQPIVGTPLSPDLLTELQAKFTTADVYQLPLDELRAQLDANAETITVQLGERTWALDLYTNDLIAPNYQLRVADADGVTTQPAPTIGTYRGMLADRPDSEVALTVADGFLYGFVRDGALIEYFEPARGFQAGLANDDIVIYEPTAITDATGTCAVTETHEHDPNVKNNTAPGGSRAGDCFTTELAIASDFSYYQARGSSTANVINYTAGVINNVQNNYQLNGNVNFDDGIQYLIVENFIATSNASDPWTTSNDAGTLLNSFTSWANQGGFNATHDMGQLWTDRNLTSTSNGTTSSGVAGLAWTGTNVVCSSNRYHILEDFSSNAQALRVLVAHEMGHNWGANHDASGSSFIMAPSVNITNAWSSQSQNSIQQGINQASANCLSSCGTGPPISDFTANSTVGCPGSTIQFENISTNGSNVYSWSFPGGTPATSTQANPTVTYPSVGTYSVSFTASNNSGTGNTETKANFIRIVPPPSNACVPGGTAGSGGIRRFAIGTLEDLSGTASQDGGAYVDKACDEVAELEPGLLYPVEITVGNSTCSGSNPFAFVRIFIDYNNDGDFTDAGELVETTNGQSFCGANINSTFQIPLEIRPPSNPPVVNQIVRMRVVATQSFTSDPCASPGSGQVIDYGVAFINAAALPVDFLSFRAQNQAATVALDWATATETNNDYFAVERSADGRAFTEIGQVTGRGSSTQRADYTHLDRQPLNGTSYYRLAQYDHDGTRSYSEVVSVRRDGDATFTVTPNPVHGGEVQIRYTHIGPAQLELFDVNGRRVQSFRYSTGEPGTTYRWVATDALPQGVYTLVLAQNGTRQTQRLVVLK